MLKRMSLRIVRHLQRHSPHSIKKKYLDYFHDDQLVPYTAKFTNSGKMKTKPKQAKFGLIKIIFLLSPAIMIGAFFSNKCAEVLEETKLFIPDD